LRGLAANKVSSIGEGPFRGEASTSRVCSFHPMIDRGTAPASLPRSHGGDRFDDQCLQHSLVHIS
jgi:hypothetical protein